MLVRICNLKLKEKFIYNGLEYFVCKITEDKVFYKQKKISSYENNYFSRGSQWKVETLGFVKSLKSKARKPVISKDSNGDILQFESIGEAARMLKMYKGNITDVLQGKRPKAKGYSFSLL